MKGSERDEDERKREREQREIEPSKEPVRHAIAKPHAHTRDFCNF